MELESLNREVTKLKAEKAVLQSKSKLFESFAAMAHYCCRLPSEADWESLKSTLRKTVEFSVDFMGAEQGGLVLLDRNGVVTDSILMPAGKASDRCCASTDQILKSGLAAWVIDHHQTGLITDTLEDSRWQPLSHQLQTARSVLAVPILKCDELLGILTLTHTETNCFSSESVEQMKAISDQIALTLENARLYGRLNESYQSLNRSKKEIEAYSRALDEELEKGRQIQRDFLPREIPRLHDWEIETYFAPAKQVSGDFYDVFALPSNNIGIVIADVCDKGVGSALYMALTRSLIRVFSGHISLHGFSNYAVNNALTKTVAAHAEIAGQVNALNAVKLTNDYIAHEHGKEGMFATLCFGVINPVTGLLVYINGGHEPLFVVDSSAQVKKILKPTGPAVGVMVDSTFEIHRTQMDPGDTLIGFTDGVTEASSPQGDLFTKKRLVSILEKPASSAAETVECIKNNIFNHTQNAPLSDDITLLAVKRLALT